MALSLPRVELDAAHDGAPRLETLVSARSQFLKESNSTDPFEWSDGPGLTLYSEPLSTLADGLSYIIGHNGTHYMAYASLQKDLLGGVTSEVRVLHALFE